MDIEIKTLSTLISVFIALIGLIITLIGVSWKLARHLSSIEVNIAKLVGATVTHEQCSLKREKCPCIKDIEYLQKQINDKK